MKLAEFKYHRPKTVKEACSLKERLRDASFLSGGTFLLPLARKTSSISKNIISLRSIQKLSDLSIKRNTLTIGSMVSLDDLCCDVLIKERLPFLCDVICSVSSAQIRNMATVGGSICCGLPWVDLPIALLVLDAQIELGSLKSDSSVSALEFFHSPKLVLKNKLLKYIKIKVPNSILPYAFVRIPKDTQADIPLVSVCVVKTELKNNKQGAIFAVNFGNRFAHRLTEVEKMYSANKIVLKWESKLKEAIKNQIQSLQHNQYRTDVILACFKRAIEKINK